MTRTMSRIAALAVAAVIAVACGGNGDDGGAAPASDVTLVTTEFAFEPDAFTIAADTDVTVTIDNSGGAVEHDFVVDDLDVNIHAEMGETVSGTVNAPAGTYTFYCSVPGHRSAGMEGTMTVS